MYLTDYHIHTKYSFDSEAQPDDICEAAIRLGLKEIALTDHMDIFSDKPYGYILDCPSWYDALYKLKEKYAGRLDIAVGIELGQPQANKNEALEFLEKYPLDFIIGSVHNMENDIDAYDMDFTKVDYHEVMRNYVHWLIELAKNYDFDVMGHITYPSRYVYIQTGQRVDFTEYYDEYSELFRCLIERGKGIELNLSGIARGLDETMPDMGLLKMYRNAGGEIITIGSDAHIPEHVGIVSKTGCEMLYEAGFEYINTFHERKIKSIKL